jgi:flagellar hook-associated protein 3 FlgL
MGLANTRDAMGNYLFSGFQTGTPAFSKDPVTGAVQYDGDQGQRLLQVDASRQMSVSSTGQAVFQGGGQDMFQTLNDLVTLLQTPVATPADAANLTSGLATASGNLNLALDNVSAVRAAVGSRLQELDSLDVLGEDRNLQYSQILSELQDVDYVKAITQLSQQQVMLEAAQKSFVKTSGLSLFNFI